MAIQKVKVQSPITVNATGTTPINGTFIEYRSTTATGSTAASQVRYTLLGFTPFPPDGTLIRGGNPVTTFTQAEVNAGLISYRADPTNKTIVDVTMRLRATDLTDNSSETFTTVIRYSLPDNAPEGTVGELTVEKSSSAKITRAQIDFTDLYDSANAIFIVIQAWPTNGDLYYNGNLIGPSSTQKISMADIDSGRLEYRHRPGNEELEDKVLFKVRDTKNKWSGALVGEPTEANANVYELPITIGNKPIRVVENGPLRILQCAEETITEELLFAEDPDSPTLTLIYTVTVLPLTGILKKNGSPMSVGTTWTDADILAGAITYEQDCSNTPKDSFEWSVEHQDDKVEKNVFEINLIPNLPPIVDINTLEVPKCDGAVADELNIKITDPEGLTPDQIKIRFAPDTAETPKPKHGSIRIKGSTALPGVTEFTYQDILDGNLVYIHDCTVHDPLTDEFHFIVIDGSLQFPHVLPILIIVPEDKPPFVVENVIHPVERNGEVSFGKDELDFDDEDTVDASVFFEITSLPEHGTLFVNGNPVLVGAKFSRAEWATVNWRYVANAPDVSILQDAAGFKLYDDNNVVEGLTIEFRFPPPPVVCPDVLSNTLFTSYQINKVISELELYASNDDVEPEEFVWSLIEEPLYGDLLLSGQKVGIKNTPVLSWTSRDILNMQLSYTHTQTTPPADSFKFAVTNGFCSVQGTFAISFVPGLEIEINLPLTVTQGGGPGTIDNTLLLSTSGAVNGPDKIKYKVDSKPKYGTLFLDGVELDLTLPVSFTQEDIDLGRLTYEAIAENETEDEDLFKFTVTDDIETREGIFLINIILLDLPPTLTMNELVVGELSCKTLTVNNIRVEDTVSTPSQLVFTILEATIHGTMTRSGSPLTQSSTFTYQDIIDGFISYCETTEGALLDSFDFTLEDSGGNQVTPVTFPIRIIPPPPPELVNEGMIVDPCSVRTISRMFLDVDNLRTTFDRSLMVFTVTEPPARGTLALGAVPLAAGDTFTLADIDGGRVTYTGGSFKLDPDAFKFDVNSPVFNTTDETFEIKFKQVNNPPWVCANNLLDVFELETKAITLVQLQLCDVDLDRDSIVDLDPESDDDVSGVTWEEGQVITPAMVDDNGRVTKDVGLQTVGAPMKLTFTVTSGSARAWIRDHNGTVLVATPCQTVSSGAVEYLFTPIVTSTFITCQVAENCVTGTDPADWTFDITSSV